MNFLVLAAAWVEGQGMHLSANSIGYLVEEFASARPAPLVASSVGAYLVAALLFAGWAIYWGGLPQFSQVGIIK